MARDQLKSETQNRNSTADIGGQKMLGYRARTGFGGMIVVTAVLLLIQLITGVEAFPL